MAQTHLPLEFAAAQVPPALSLRRIAAADASADDVDAVGFEIGWDHAHHALIPPLEHLHDGSPVRQGWGAGRAAFGRRTLRASPQVRLWLQLRLAAWRQGAAFEGIQVTPHFLAQIAAAQCPVTRAPLTHASGADSDAAVERVNRGAGYAAGNLATVSVRAGRAMAGRSWHDALELARRIERGESAEADGLGAADWQRLGVLMSFVTPLPHPQAAALPLSVLPPNRLRVLNPVQALQVMLTRLFTSPGYARRMLGLAALMPCAASRQALQLFMHTLLARRIAAGAALDRAAARQAMEDSWADALVVRRWRALAQLVTAAQCEQLLQRAARRGLTPASSRWVDAQAATDGWALDRDGYVDCGAMSRTPGVDRSLGSQKLAS
jgi:hypothetical protein